MDLKRMKMVIKLLAIDLLHLLLLYLVTLMQIPHKILFVIEMLLFRTFGHVIS